MSENTENINHENASADAAQGEAPGQQKYAFAGVPPASQRPPVSLEEFYKIANLFAERVFGNEAIALKLRASGMVLRMEYFDPEVWGDGVEAAVTIDFTQDPIKLTLGTECDLPPKVTLRMHSDIAHRFWVKKIALMVGVARRQMLAKGPVPMIMRLIPTLKPSYMMYKQVLVDLGMMELVNYPDPYVPGEEPAGPDDAPAGQ